MELIDETERIAPHAGSPVRIELGDLLARDADRPAEAAFEQPDRLQQRGFARAGRTQQRDDLARADMEIDPAQHLDGFAALAERARQAGNAEDGFTHSAIPAQDRCSPL